MEYDFRKIEAEWQQKWKDTKAYDSQTGMYWVYNYYVKAFKTVNGKRIYSKPTKTINLYS